MSLEVGKYGMLDKIGLLKQEFIIQAEWSARHGQERGGIGKMSETEIAE